METSNLCAKIPIDLHQKVREKQQESGVPLGDYMADLLEKYFKMTEDKKMNDKNRTLAFQVTDEDFYRLKAHMKRCGEKQKEFMHRVIFDVITAAEAEIPTEELQDQLLEAEISGEKKPRNRVAQAEEPMEEETSEPEQEETSELEQEETLEENQA